MNNDDLQGSSIEFDGSQDNVPLSVAYLFTKVSGCQKAGFAYATWLEDVLRDVKDLMGVVIDELYAGLTGGSAELPLPPRTKINWVLPGIPLHESFFNFAIAGPYAGPSPTASRSFADIDGLVGVVPTTT